ncbi:LysR substrate-binding domain-containing protein [Paraburkholderia sp.]|uniref:LysR family transcriptional regulator n=1 Tax=Paraburkholderia sp. TaxID=1926495 RepID=UPI0023860542|nr:LysR substrate-binding domain-containing protein [Paraburkholderia sp.]MDE1180460.1 LysR substrate-binding domain-containing protein [Paraburkholderia sp.]
MKLHQLRSLIAVAENGSIHEASRALHITQPAVSKSLSDLETELGAPLFVRSAKGAQLTPYGQSLIRHARAIEQELRHAHEDIATLLGVARGTVTVGVTPVSSTGPFAAALRAFSGDYPQVNVNVFELRPAQIQEGLADGSLDFGLVSRIGQPSDTRFYWETLYTVPTTLAVRKDHPMRGARSLRTLTDARWLSWDALDDTTSLIGSMFSVQDIAPPKHVLRCTSTSLYAEMATTTDVVSLWSELPFHMPEYRTRLRKIALHEPLPDMTIGLICRDIDLMTTMATTLIGLIRDAGTEFSGLFQRAGARPKKHAKPDDAERAG